MKQILSWNVTGIPPEVREIARAAAARDGVSVGDWLTRCIYLESQHELQEAQAAPTSQPAQREDASETPNERNEVMMQLARMEGATEAALRRIDETLRTFAHSGGATDEQQGQAKVSERSAKTKIDAAIREQAQIISGLTRRVENVERSADSATLRKAIRGLHLGVSRLAEQVAKNEIGTANRMDALEGNIDSVSRLALETRSKSNHFARDLEERLNALTEQIARSEETLGGIGSHIQDAVEDHFFPIERTVKDVSVRLDVTERAQGQQARAIEDGLNSFEERLAMVERHSRERSSEFRRSLEAMRERLDAAVHKPHEDHENDAEAPNGDIPISLPGMSQELALGTENQTVAHAVQRFLSVGRRPTGPEAEEKKPAGTITLASVRPHRGEDIEKKEGAPLRRVLPALSVALLVAAGAGYLIVSSIFGPVGASAEPVHASSPPAGEHALEASTAILALGADSLSPLEGNERPAAHTQIPLNAEEGSATDLAEALSLYEDAAQRGHRSAMHNLAVAYATGIGIERNLAEASRWFRSAADLGFSDSQFNLAVLYERGMGVPMSLEDAYKWYLVAAHQGDTEARTRAEVLSAHLSEEQRTASERTATTYAVQPPKQTASELPRLAQLQ